MIFLQKQPFARRLGVWLTSTTDSGHENTLPPQSPGQASHYSVPYEIIPTPYYYSCCNTPPCLPATVAAVNSWGMIVAARFIIWKIWGITRSHSIIVETHPGIALIVESSALYTFIFLNYLKSWALFFTVTQQANSVLGYFAFGVFPTIAGVSYASTDRHEEVDRA
ncbi:hypothetical protein C8R44DRAFT_740545 [Mycena epipterygia]|nr:hypothetical protein C8R44DRAFT_740545 [Mycena epipterygia]